ncbi:hypothetical protein CKM354_000107000 [Cercospora kikuchii]|uniref:chitinase n=1 Tax=Cercospora kikuchii TaxID=84275 RepID=A0A9P3CA79_9PEZI|nr:uncharacterized protein CKM354_000107000 [Cercospora kikuchii]GIZ37627.1 hypothetical protein CKM354_000107000 [Cercospora kikuchii]
MPSFFLTSALAATVISSASAQFNPTGKTNVVTYWGQGPNQARLVETCKNSAVDVINIGFVTRFPDQTGTGYPETNFGNACWGDVYQNSTGQDTTLLKTCPFIGPDVIECQKTYGKKIFLSIGGGYPADYFFSSDANARAFADFIWGAWGPVNSSWTGPRPWGDAVVDGFDFDIESVVSPANRLTAGYTACINRLKNILYPQDTSKSYYISGAPQCVLPDAHFTSVIRRAWFDFLWIQFYNTPQCSARAGINNQNGSNKNLDITFANWTQAESWNKNIKYYIGLPAAPKAAAGDSYYLTPAEVQRTVARFYSNSRFAGLSKRCPFKASSNHSLTGDQLRWAKDILNGQAAGRPAVVTCPTTTTTRTTTTAARTTTTTPRVTTTSVRTTTTSRRSTTTSRRTTTSVRRKRAEPTAFITRTRVVRAAPTSA